MKGFIAASLLLLACTAKTGNTSAHSTGTMSLKDSCDHPDAPFSCMTVGMPASLSAEVTIAAQNEPGDRLRISGRLLMADGKTPAAGVRMYLWHTNAKGIYPTRGNETGVFKHHGYLHGWLQTNEAGEYTILSIRPATYPSRDAPAHIHAAVWPANGGAPYYISDFVFADDPLVNAAYLQGLRRWNMPGKTGVVQLQAGETGWVGQRDIVLK